VLVGFHSRDFFTVDYSIYIDMLTRFYVGISFKFVRGRLGPGGGV